MLPLTPIVVECDHSLSRSSDLVKWSFNGLVITPDLIKCPVINSKEQRKGVLSILELTSLDETNSQECPVRHLSTYLRASKGRRKPHSGDSGFIQNEGKPLDVKENNIIVSIARLLLPKEATIILISWGATI
ncbi:hypothetical protein ACTFIW_003855 [Dictyostelium discoideum]